MNPRTKSQDIRDLSQNDIRELVAELGQPAFRAKQLIEWVFGKNVCSFDDMTNLPKAFREQLKEALPLTRRLNSPSRFPKMALASICSSTTTAFPSRPSACPVVTNFPSAFPPRQAVAWAVPFALPVSTASSAL